MIHETVESQIISLIYMILLNYIAVCELFSLCETRENGNYLLFFGG